MSDYKSALTVVMDQGYFGHIRTPRSFGSLAGVFIGPNAAAKAVVLEAIRQGSVAREYRVAFTLRGQTLGFYQRQYQICDFPHQTQISKHLSTA